jgi:heterodisulfide reductase subunit A
VTTDHEPQASAAAVAESDEPRRRIGVYVCHCGGNISDYVDVAAVRDAVAGDAEVVHVETTLFACSDATQNDMIEMIESQHLDGLVVASCSPKLHVPTFRAVSRRAGLNPFEYTQVNIREQCSWVHSDDRTGATAKAIGLVRAGIAKTAHSVPLEPITVETTPSALVVGAGVAGMRAAIGLADLGLRVYVIERAATLGGWVGRWGPMYPNGSDGHQLIEHLRGQVAARDAITVVTNAELVAKSGNFGNYDVDVRVASDPPTTQRFRVGSIVVATGFDTYQPEVGEYGYGIDGVLTLAEFKELVDAAPGPLRVGGRPVRTVTYIYCVGSRQPDGNQYCSRYCCAATVHASITVADHDAAIAQYHLYRDVRTYGKLELLYEESRRRGSVYMKFPDDTPPAVRREESGQLVVRTTDTLTEGMVVDIPTDVVVLVTGMVPRDNHDLTSLLKLPVGGDGFYNEIHPKLRPVETVVDGVLIAGTCQGPKNSFESVASGLAAVAQSGATLLKGVAELDPLVVTVDQDRCTWCGACQEVCPYGAIDRIVCDGREVATVNALSCKGCGGCAAFCANEAIELLGSTTRQIESMIDGMLEGSSRDEEMMV